MTGQVFDLADKLEQSETQLGRGSFMLGMGSHEKKSEDKLHGPRQTKDGYVTYSKVTQGTAIAYVPVV